jgi:hypothetical protein
MPSDFGTLDDAKRLQQLLCKIAINQNAMQVSSYIYSSNQSRPFPRLDLLSIPPTIICSLIFSFPKKSSLCS